MATANKTYDTRIQLKHDTEENWNKAGPKQGSSGFVPLAGELIIYSADNAHPFSRLKVGNGVTNVVNLPFIDAGTLNGTEVEIVKSDTYAALPIPGSEDKLYIVTATGKLYHYIKNRGYSELMNITFSTTSISVAEITGWSAGIATNASISKHKLIITNGTTPSLQYSTRSAISSITQGDDA